MSRLRQLLMNRPDLESAYRFGTLTDREYFIGQGTLAQQFEGEESVLKKVVAQARREGYEPGINDVYNGTIATHQGDSKAFVPPTGGRGHINRVCEMRNQPIEGMVNYTPDGRPPDPITHDDE